MIVKKPWGQELIFANNEHYLGKILHIKALHSTSFHKHLKKHETMLFGEGKARYYYGKTHKENHKDMEKGDIVVIKPGTAHSIYAFEDTVIFEVSTPHPNDVVRIFDNYGRV